MKTIYHLNEIDLTKLQPETVIFIDIDDTIITPQSKVFHHNSPNKHLIDDIKKERDKIANFEEILSNWRLQRKPMLVDDSWPEKILTADATVYALTQMDTGKIGNIPSIENWRYQELKSLGVNFFDKFLDQEKVTLISSGEEKYPAIFYQGFFITGSFKKSDIVKKFIELTHYKLIIFIDDREEHVLDVMEASKQLGVSCECILYRGVELIPGAPKTEIAEFQKQTLLSQAKWLDDNEAEIIWQKNIGNTQSIHEDF